MRTGQHRGIFIEIGTHPADLAAAENPVKPPVLNLSHPHDVEHSFRIFERRSRGVLAHDAKRIDLSAAHAVPGPARDGAPLRPLTPKRAVANSAALCIPRSAAMLDLDGAARPDCRRQMVDAVIRECHARTALETLASGETEIGVIRFRSEYRDYFDEQTSARA